MPGTVYNRALTFVARSLYAVKLGKFTAPDSDEVVQVPSREAGRSIKTYLYKSHHPCPAGTPAPLLLNWHGSGFTLNLHGSDNDFCAQVARETPYSVLDLSYRLSPEHVYPAALEDVEDAIRWVLSQPEQWDSSKLALSGFSAGAYFSLVMASLVFPEHTFRSVIAFYPPLDAASDPASKLPPDSKNGNPLPPWVVRLFFDNYAPLSKRNPIDRKDPKISPLFLDLKHYPDNILFITAACDSLCEDAEDLASKLQAAGKKGIRCERMMECEHAWEKSPCKEGSMQHKEKERAYALAIETLNGSLEA
ncbi:hypothetical protein RGQ29_032098 [Quercus rubra]|uniref:Alpha/beta hydrolase fold-3 domain-containing protein n=1 Tax=Quercus rubra TaxID=3512 RepID=A0AAN7DU90_QUERU|nr:hypothetical protein RGQ29_032098 [Quercus rubra]